jgi:hypothetical protein
MPLYPDAAERDGPGGRRAGNAQPPDAEWMLVDRVERFTLGRYDRSDSGNGFCLNRFQ